MKGNFLMNRPLLSVIMISCLLLIGCEDKETNNNQTGEEVITHDIDAIGASGFYSIFPPEQSRFIIYLACIISNDSC